MQSEPALILGVVQAVIALAISFGLHLTPAQVGAITALAAAISAFIVRAHVSPVK